MTLTDRQYRHALFALIALGAVLRLIGLNWDEGRGLHPDEGNLVRAAMTLGVDGRWIPDFHAYNDLALWLPRLLSLPVCGLHDVACTTVIARLLSALMSVAAIPLAAGVARQLAGHPASLWAGLAAAAATATAAPLIQWAHFGTTESALIFLVLALWRVSALWQSGEISDRSMALSSAVLLGLGFGMKTTAVVISLIPLGAVVLRGWQARMRFGTLLYGPLLAVCLALLSTPSVWRAPKDWLDVMRFENGVVTGAIPVFWTAQFAGATNGWYEIWQLWSALHGAGLILAVAGLILLPSESRRLALPALFFAVTYAVISFGWTAKFFRYLAPFLPICLVFVGVAIGRLAMPIRSRFVLSLSLAGLGLMAMAGIDLAASYMRIDPRIAAGEFLTQRADASDIVAIEPHDVAQTGGRPATTLPLTAPELTAQALAAALAEAEWVQIASRRNWEVLPRQPDASPFICTYYAALAQGNLGFVPVKRFIRQGPFGHLFYPGLFTEETRSAFDRPEVFLFRNIGHLSEADLYARLSQPDPNDDCTGLTLQTSWRRGP